MTTTFYLNAPTPNKNYDYIDLETKEAPLWHHLKSLMYTATGYGSKIPTIYKVKHNNRWKRVYCHIYSNFGTLYIKDVNGNARGNTVIQSSH